MVYDVVRGKDVGWDDQGRRQGGVGGSGGINSKEYYAITWQSKYITLTFTEEGKG